jgi:chloramphenicol 3-O-phosphotransferase
MSAHVACDEMMPWMSDATLGALRSRGGNVLPDMQNEWLSATACAFGRQGIDVVIDWFFPSDSELADLLRRLEKRQISARVFNLLCSPEEHLARDRQRDVEGQIGQEGIDYFRRAGSWLNSPYGRDLDTTAMSPEDVARAIVAGIEAEQAVPSNV